MPFLKGDTASPRKSFYYILGKKLWAVRKGPWKLMINNRVEPRLEPINLGSLTLFNLELDPGERYDFSKKHPEIVAELQAMLVNFDAEMGRMME